MQTGVRLQSHSVDLKRVPPKSRPAASPEELLLREKRPARTPPSTFLFLPIHLSKSPENRTMSPNLCNSAMEPSAPDRFRVRRSPNIVDELQRHAIAPRRRRTVSAFICPLAPNCQLDSAPKSRAVDNSPRGLTELMLHDWGQTIAGRPHSSRYGKIFTNFKA